jgi:putative transposase
MHIKSASEASMSNRLRTSNHAAFSLHYHVILSVKYRHKCITGDMLERMREIFASVCQSWRCELVEFGGQADHVHLLVDAQPSMDLARFVGNLKTVSSRYIRKEYAQQLRRFFWKARFWNSAYGVVTAAGHASIEQLLEHIQDQERPP